MRDQREPAPFTGKQLDAILRGRHTGFIRRLARQALTELALNSDLRDHARRTQDQCDLERKELTRVRPEHELVLVRFTRPLGDGGLPCIEVHSGARVKVLIELPGDKPKREYDIIEQVYPQIQVIPPWLYEYHGQ